MRNVDPEPRGANGSAQAAPDAQGRSTLRDIAHRALAGVGVEERDRIWLALENPRGFLAVDADLLSSSITHLIERSVRTNTSQILLRARHDDEGASFSVLSGDQRPDREAPCTQEATNGLSGTLETVALLGGSLSVRHTREGQLHACIHIPARAGRGLGA